MPAVASTARSGRATDGADVAVDGIDVAVDHIAGAMNQGVD